MIRKIERRKRGAVHVDQIIYAVLFFLVLGSVIVFYYRVDLINLVKMFLPDFGDSGIDEEAKGDLFYDERSGTEGGVEVDSQMFLISDRINKDQINGAHPDLIKFLECFSREYFDLQGQKIVVTSITDDGIYGNNPTCKIDDKNEIYNQDSNCVHTKTSCHYNYENGELKSKAVDIRTKGYNFEDLLAAFNSCKKPEYSSLNEGDHLHVQLGKCKTYLA